MKKIVPALVLLALAAGCSRDTYTTDPSASPALNTKAACEAAGGKWKALTHHCDTD